MPPWAQPTSRHVSSSQSHAWVLMQSCGRRFMTRDAALAQPCPLKVLRTDFYQQWNCPEGAVPGRGLRTRARLPLSEPGLLSAPGPPRFSTGRGQDTAGVPAQTAHPRGTRTLRGTELSRGEGASEARGAQAECPP